jgi:PAS domain S-box-containing protein
MSHTPQSSKKQATSGNSKKELKTNGAPIEQLFEVLPDAVVVTDSTGKIQFANKQTEKLFGYQLEELSGKPVEILIPARFAEHGRQRDAYNANPQTRLMGSKLALFARRKEGIEFPVDIALSPLETDDGNFVVAIIRDITSRNLMVQNLKRSEARNRALLNAIPDLMFRIHRDGTIWDYKADNPDTLYISPVSFLGRKLSEILPQDVAERALYAIERVVETGLRRSFEYSLPLANGLRYFEAWIAPSTPDEFVFIIRDVTAYRQAEERYRNTLDNMLEGCQIIDFDWRYVYANEAAARQGHSKPEELLHRTMMEVYPGIDHTEMFRVLRRCMEERQSESIENEFTFQDGTMSQFELMIEPIPEGLLSSPWTLLSASKQD